MPPTIARQARLASLADAARALLRVEFGTGDEADPRDVVLSGLILAGACLDRLVARPPSSR